MLHKILKPFSITIVSLLIMGFGFYIVRNSLAQVSLQEISNAQLLKEYFLPINALVPKEDGRIFVGGAECDQIGVPDSSVDITAGVYDGKKHRSILSLDTVGAYVNCNSVNIDKDLGYSPVLNVSTTTTRKTVNGLEFQEGNGTAVYKINITKPSVYHLSLGAYNSADSFDGLTRNQYEDVKTDVYSSGSNYDYPYASFMPSSALEATHKELSARRLMFQIAIDDPDNIIGIVDVLDDVEKKYGNLMLGLLEPGQHTVFVTFANDLEIDLGFDTSKVGSKCTPKESCSSGLSCLNQNSESVGVCGLSQINLGNFLSADINKDGKLEKNPVVTDLIISETQSTNDVIGVRVFNNPAHLSALDWYTQNLVNQGNPVPVIVDGYNGVLDQRTAYINAANISASGVFYTNIYVIAHNINASPQTIEVFNRIVSNWKFNKNIIELDGEIAGELVKDKLRRDVTRLEHLNFVRKTLEDYKASNGFYPKLEAGTFVTGKAMSTWGTWQTVLSSLVGQVMPVDPLNMMSDEFFPGGSANSAVPRQYDCTNQYEATHCKNICTRDSEDKPLTGCPLNEQCFGSSYCSIIPSGYDALTGWSEDNQSHYFSTKANGVYPEGTFNTGGDDLSSPSRFNDDAFVYQYATNDSGKTYAFTYRLEYRNFCTERYANGSCKTFSNTLCGPGSCYLETTGQCVTSGASPYNILLGNLTGLTEEQKKARQDLANPYSNLYCFGGQLVNSCGNGIYQPEAGETCEFTQDFSNGLYCDQKFTQQNWYNEKNIGDKCTSSCRLASDVTAGQLPVAYNPQAPGQSCGGFCGDGVTQYEFYEQCDVTNATGLVPSIAVGGSGGVSADSQYACTVPTGATVKSANLITDASFESISNFGNNVFSAIPATINDNWSYTGKNYSNFEDLQTGVKYPGIEVSARQARTGIKSLFLQKNSPVSSPVNRVVFVTREINPLQTYSFEAWVKKELAMQNQSDNQDIRVVVEFFDASKNVLKLDSTSSSADDCSAVGTGGDCIVYANTTIKEMSSDRWTKLSSTFTPPASAKYVNVGIMVPDSVDSNIYALYVDDIRLAALAGCQTYGGYCGDGITQAAYGEQCDIASHVPPTPKRSVDQIVNGSFESGFDSWIDVNKSGQYEPGVTVPNVNFSVHEIVKIDNLTLDHASGGFKSFRFSPNLSGLGVGQRVVYQPLASGTTLKVRVDARVEGISPAGAPLVLEARAFQYDYTRGISSNFGEGLNTLGYLSSPMKVVAKEIDENTGKVTESLTAAVGINSFYKTYEATLTLPSATTANSNAVTLVAVVLVNPSLEDGDVLPTNENYLLDEFSVRSNYRLNYLCGKVTNKLCQFSGGYCGDGITQIEFGESCDGGENCSQFCSYPSCGDGIKDRIYNPVTKRSTTEKCDYSDSKDINNNHCLGCTKITTGGSCSSNEDCSGGNCLAGKCSTGFGEAGCTIDSCPDGWLCESSTKICRPKLDVYLKGRFSIDGLKYGEKIVHCPFFKNTGANLIDSCTGVAFSRTDSIGSVKSQFDNLCGSNYQTPSIKQLYSMAVSDSTGKPYLDNNSSSYVQNSMTKVCSVNGQNASDSDRCNEVGDPRYLYWSSTPYESNEFLCDTGRVEDPYIICTTEACKTGKVCKPRYFYAVDFKKKTVDVIESNSKINSRCVSEVKCGDGRIDGEEQCDFDPSGLEFFQDSGAVSSMSYCSTNPEAKKRANYDAGRVHCDITSCKYRFDNCVIRTKEIATQDSCVEICSTVNKSKDGNGDPILDLSTVKSFGTNLTETYPSLSAVNNIDVNRRPKLKTGNYLEPHTLPATIDIATQTSGLSLTSNTDYILDSNNKPIYPSKDIDSVTLLNDSNMYSTADDGLVVTWVGSLCKYFWPDTSRGGYVTTPSLTGSCPLGFVAISAVSNWTTFNPYSGIGASSVFSEANGNKIKPEATLCRCQVPPAPVDSVTTGSDNPQIQAINDAALLVSIAEETQLKADFQAAQAAVLDLFVLLTNDQEAKDLQDRLNILAESIVIKLETSTANVKDEIYSYWKFNEGKNRISYNSGSGRGVLELGNGLNMSMNCAGINCVKTINWPTHNVCSNNISKSCNSDTECGSGNTCQNGFSYSTRLDGRDDYMSTASDYLSLSKGTVSMWVKFDSLEYNTELVPYTNPAFGLFSYFKDSDEYLNFKLVDKNKLELSSNGTICVSASVPGINTTDWNHIAFTYDFTSDFTSDSFKIYFNGSEVGSDNDCNTAPGSTLGQNIVFGAAKKAETTTGPILGSDLTDFSPIVVDDIYIYDEVKSLTQINALRVVPTTIAVFGEKINSIARTIYNLVTWLR